MDEDMHAHTSVVSTWARMMHRCCDNTYRVHEHEHHGHEHGLGHVASFHTPARSQCRPSTHVHARVKKEVRRCEQIMTSLLEHPPPQLSKPLIPRGEGSSCNLVCTQPRRIAAIGVAERVASERAEAVGGTVGYR